MSHTNLCIWQLSQLDRGRPDGVDGDEEPRSGGVVTMGGVPEGEGGVSVGTPTEAAPGSDESVGPVDDAVDEPSASADETTVAAADEAESTDPESSDAEPTDAEPTDLEPTDLEPTDAEPNPAPSAPRRAPRRTYVRRGLAATGVTLVVALSVSAFAMVGPTTANVDQSFVDTARSQGHAVVPGDHETLVVSAARKICDRRENHSTVAQRRATALSPEELGAVQQTFATDVRGFTSLALATYCPS
jgi:uncharacterized protein DUF732